jgi:RHS repeat-associated protein
MQASGGTRGGAAYLGKDILGSVRSVSNETGALEDRYEYDAFGTPYTGDFSSGMNLGYTGKPYDSATGLYDYGYRDYQPEVARFTTVDPIRDGNNWFAYVNNDPVNYVDPWGLSPSDRANQTSIPQEPMLEGWPVNTGTISSNWGPREAPVPGTGNFHSGLDIAVPNGTPVYATGNGVVSQVANHTNYGNVVSIQMDNGLVTADMHLQSTNVTVGTRVTTGQQIGTTGTTGTFTTGGHDHFSVWNTADNVPNFGNKGMIVPRETINPIGVLPNRPDSINGN